MACIQTRKVYVTMINMIIHSLSTHFIKQRDISMLQCPAAISLSIFLPKKLFTTVKHFILILTGLSLNRQGSEEISWVELFSGVVNVLVFYQNSWS